MADSGSRPIGGLGMTSPLRGIVWMFGLGSLLAVLTGQLALRRIAGRRQRGRRAAVAGLVLGHLGLLMPPPLLQGGVTIEEDVPR